MSYQVRLGEEALATLAKLPPVVRAGVVRELRRLASDPVTLSRPATFPHARDGQLFDITLRDGEREHYITVMFRYVREERLDVAWLVHITRSL
jgi:hypothetical protein